MGLAFVSPLRHDRSGTGPRAGCSGRRGGCRSQKYSNFGAGNNVVRLSRNWSVIGLTRAKLAERRVKWAAEQAALRSALARGQKAPLPDRDPALDHVKKKAVTTVGGSKTRKMVFRSVAVRSGRAVRASRQGASRQGAGANRQGGRGQPARSSGQAQEEGRGQREAGTRTGQDLGRAA